MSKFNAIFLPLAFTLLIILGGLYYYQKNSEQNTKTVNNTAGQPQVLGTSSTNNSPVMSNYNEYSAKVLEIRTPINKGVEDLISKTKYSTLFDKDTLTKEANDVKTSINSGIKTLKELSLNATLAAVNQKQIRSLELINEAMDAYIALQNAEDSTEKQKQSELVSYKIDVSNKEIQTSSASPSVNSNNSSSTGSNAINVVQ